MKRHVVAFGATGLLALAASGSAHAGFVYGSIIDPLNPTFTQALGINNTSEIAGYGNATIFNGFTLTLPANFTRLNFPGADGGTQVVGISNGASPTTVGFYILGGLTHGFANTGGQGGTFTTVDRGAPFTFTQLLGINHDATTAAGYWTTDPAGATGQIAGTVSGGPSFTSPSFTNINALLPSNFNSQATGVNDAGEAVGFYQLNNPTPPTTPLFSAFTDIGGVITSFQAPGAVSTQALGVNDLGEIVGDFVDSGGVMHGFLDNNNVFTTLDPPGSTATTANGTNDKGQIVGFFVTGNGNTVGFIAQVPEPASMLALGAGLIGLAAARRRPAEAASA